MKFFVSLIVSVFWLANVGNVAAQEMPAKLESGGSAPDVSVSPSIKKDEVVAPMPLAKSLIGKKYSGSMPSNRGRTTGFNLTIQSFDGKDVQGTMVLYYPSCNGDFPVKGTGVGTKLDLRATGNSRCDGVWVIDLNVEDGGKFLTGKIQQANGNVVDVTLR